LSAVDTKGTERVKIPKWESELWSYMRRSDGAHCPLYDSCAVRSEGFLCPCDYVDYVKQLMATRQFDTSDYEFIERITFYRMFELAERLANKYLEKGKVECPPVPTELVSLADEQHPIEVRLVPLRLCNGATWHFEDSWVIQLNKNDPPATRRFTLFHEAFHILARCKGPSRFMGRGVKKGSFCELLAERFAASILMPRDWVSERWAEVNDLDKMAKIFYVPQPVMYIELKLLHLI